MIVQHKCLVIIDPWARHGPGETYTKIILSLEKIKYPVVMVNYDETPYTYIERACRNGTNQMPYNDGVGSYNYSNRIKTNDESIFLRFLMHNNITELNYCGVSFPGCVWHRPLGMQYMKDKFKCNVVIDLCDNNYTQGPTIDKIHAQYKFAKFRNIPVKYSNEIYS